MVGKAGTGKTTILNAIFNKVIGNVESTAKSVTKITSIYYYKLKKNGNIIITLVDTPGIPNSERTEKKTLIKCNLDGITNQFLTKKYI